MNILIVDDNRDLADSLAFLLEEEGHRVTLACSGEEALEASRHQPFDLTLLDVKLPGIDGIEAFSRIRRERPNAAVVIMTGFRIEQLVERSAGKGAVRVLRCPFTMPGLMDAFQEIRPAGIVLVDGDGPSLSADIGRFLAGQGLRIKIAHHREEAMELVARDDVDLLLLDLRRTVIYGLDTYMELRKAGRTLPTLILLGRHPSATASPDPLRSTKVTGCLFKPFHPEAVFEVIRDLQGAAAESPS